MATEKNLTVTTTKILSVAYCEIFGITTDRGSGIGRYYGQYAGDSCIDYAHFDGHYEIPFDEDTDWFECITEDGCEGCWIRVELVRRITLGGHDDNIRRRVGIIKTLSEGRNAWKNMGALAGELAYTANDAAYKVIKRARQLAAEQEKA